MDKKHRGSIWWITILIAGLLLLLCSGMILRGISSIAQLFRTFLLGIMIAFVLDQPSKLIQNALTKKAIIEWSTISLGLPITLTKGLR